MSLDIFFNEQELLPINVELELRFQEPQATKYPFDFAEWMKEKNIPLHKDGKFYSCGWVVLKDEQVEEFYSRFIESTLKPFSEQAKDLPQLKPGEKIDTVGEEKEELEKNLNESLKVIAEQQQLIIDITDKIRTIIGIEPIEFVKKELEELKEVLLTHMEKSVKWKS